MKSQKPGQRFIKCCQRKVSGGAHMYLLVIFFILLLMVIFKMMFETERVYITKQSVDDAMMESMISACVYNTTEYSISGATVLYRNVTPFDYNSAYDDLTGTTGATVYDVLNDPELFAPGADTYLNDAYGRYVANLKKNLKLDDAMQSSLSGIDGTVSITEFSIYNCFYNLDSHGNKTEKRIVRYTRLPSGAWSAYAYAINSPAYAYSSLEHRDIEITETSIASSLTFDVVKSTFTSWLMPGYTQADMTKNVTYSRVVDITDH